MQQKLTVKEKMLRYVESLGGTATFVQIQRFIYDSKYGEGSYDYGYEVCLDWKRDSETREWVKTYVRKNTNRGFFCGAFYKGRYSVAEKKWNPGGYFLRGKDRLIRLEKGKYQVVRNYQNSVI